MLGPPTNPPPSDEELARRAQQGCSVGFEELVRRFQVPLLGFLRHRADGEEAEDLVQETFVRAYQNLHRYRPAWRFPTWLFTIARRLSMNHQRRRRPRADSAALELVEAATPGPAELMVEEESRRRLWDLAGEVLTERQMTVTWLHYVEEMPLKEIARVAGCSHGAVKTMLFRARKKLAPLVQDRKPNGSAKRSSRQAAREFTNG